MDYKNIFHTTVLVCVVCGFPCVISLNALEGVYKTVLTLVTGAFGGVFVFSLALFYAEQRFRRLELTKKRSRKRGF